jgi:hypothetical protein
MLVMCCEETQYMSLLSRSREITYGRPHVEVDQSANSEASHGRYCLQYVNCV